MDYIIRSNNCCILSKFYIKPQLCGWLAACERVVSYRNSTSNHNVPRSYVTRRDVVSYRNSTSNHNSWPKTSSYEDVVSYRNSTSNHNLKDGQFSPLSVVSYRNSTSNHNRIHDERNTAELYLIEILHQTTTPEGYCEHQYRCILSKFYIKPQRSAPSLSWLSVVSYRNSTSNHNSSPLVSEV